eukprot:scaffold101966_cov18-Tisochrysis_lutea.AAC.1
MTAAASGTTTSTGERLSTTDVVKQPCTTPVCMGLNDCPCYSCTSTHPLSQSPIHAPYVFNGAGGDDGDEVDEVAVLTQALSSALCTHAEMLVQKAVAERDFAAG